MRVSQSGDQKSDKTGPESCQKCLSQQCVDGAAISRGHWVGTRCSLLGSMARANATAIITGSPALATAVFNSTASKPFPSLVLRDAPLPSINDHRHIRELRTQSQSIGVYQAKSSTDRRPPRHQYLASGIEKALGKHHIFGGMGNTWKPSATNCLAASTSPNRIGLQTVVWPITSSLIQSVSNIRGPSWPWSQPHSLNGTRRVWENMHIKISDH